MITQEELKEILDYDPETGVFRWKTTRGTRALAGNKAGCVVNEGYIHIGIHKKYYRAHRLVFLWMTGEWPDGEVDHINGDVADNRWCNLRECTREENCRNARTYKTNKLGMKGIFQSGDKFIVQIYKDTKRCYRGVFDDLELAELVAEEARELYHGEFANHGKRC